MFLRRAMICSFNQALPKIEGKKALAQTIQGKHKNAIDYSLKILIYLHRK
jgi:hypothetical protein